MRSIVLTLATLSPTIRDECSLLALNMQKLQNPKPTSKMIPNKEFSLSNYHITATM